MLRSALWTVGNVRHALHPWRPGLSHIAFAQSTAAQSVVTASSEPEQNLGCVAHQVRPMCRTASGASGARRTTARLMFGGQTFDSPAALLAWLREAQGSSVFLKDTMDHQYDDVLADRRFLAEARHAFLIRRPEEIAASYYALFPPHDHRTHRRPARTPRNLRPGQVGTPKSGHTHKRATEAHLTSRNSRPASRSSETPARSRRSLRLPDLRTSARTQFTLSGVRRFASSIISAERSRVSTCSLRWASWAENVPAPQPTSNTRRQRCGIWRSSSR